MIRDLFLNLELPCHKIEHYFPLYERYFSKFVSKAPKILEIGVRHGGSAELWRKYFGEGTFIHGLDINPLCLSTDYLKVYIGDQSNANAWKNFPERDFDIIMDDGSHENSHQIITLENTYDKLKDGGVYFVEDVHTSYYNGVRVSNGGYKNPRSFIEYCKNLPDVVNAPHTHRAIGVGRTPGPHVDARLVGLYDHIQGVHFHDSVVVIEKGPRFNLTEITRHYDKDVI